MVDIDKKLINIYNVMKKEEFEKHLRKKASNKKGK